MAKKMTNKKEKFSPIVTIVIPVYNGSDYLGEAIDSALAQTYKNLEIIVVNDGSKDGGATDRVAKSYGQKIRYFKKENGGVSSALNFGIKKMAGQYFSWLSHDDLYLPQKIEKQIDFLSKREDKDIVLYMNWAILKDSKEIPITLDHKMLIKKPRYSLLRDCANGITLLIPKHILDEIGEFNTKLKFTQDYDYWFRIQKKYKFVHLDESETITRIHKGQDSSDTARVQSERDSLWIRMIRETPLKEKITYEGTESNFLTEMIKFLETTPYGGALDFCRNELLELESHDMPMKVLEKFSPLVTIIIPVYNGASYMCEAIDSALAQTYKNIEIIVVNDGSADNTDEIAKSYGSKIRYFSKKNGGAATALNLGIKNMKGQYFSWLSHDDMYYPNKIARQIEELRKLKNKNTIMMSDLDGINEKYEKIYQTDYTQHISNYPPRLNSDIHPVIYNQTHGCTLLIPKICFDKVGLFDVTQLVAQDFEFFHRAFLKFPHKLIPEVLVTARDSSGRVGNRCKEGANKEYSALYISIIENLTDDDISLLARDRFAFYDDMREFFQCAGYWTALKYVEEKSVHNLQVSSYDLIGNKFNGYDLHLQLRNKGIDSKQLVLDKHSVDSSTYIFDFLAKDATKKLIQQSIFLEADSVHFHLIHNIIDLNYLPIITRLKPTVLSLHDPFFLGGHCVHHFDCKKWQTHCNECPYLDEVFPLDKDISALNFELKKKAIQDSQVSAIVASKWMKDKVEKSPIWQGRKIYLLPFGVDHSLFKPYPESLAKKLLNIPNESTVIMFRADDGSFKGLDIIKKALLSLKNPRKITLITVGERGLLKELHDRFDILEYGWIKDDNQLARLYQAADIFLMPSRQETFGMMAIEAMSCGKMVLALKSDGSALPEVVNSPVCGLAVHEVDYSKELRRLLDNPREIEERGKKSLDYAQKRYSKDKFVQDMMNIYDEVISKHSLSKSSELILQQLKKVASNDLSPGLVGEGDLPSKLSQRMYLRTFVVRRKIKTVIRVILWYVSPAFRMLEGNRYRLNMILERTEKILSEREDG